MNRSSVSRKYSQNARGMRAFGRALPFLPLLFAVSIGLCGCGDDGGEDPPVCPAGRVDAQLVGNWVAIDEDGNALAHGMRISQDGTREIIGVHWASGKLAIASDACAPPPFHCAGSNLVAIPVIPGGRDTLSWLVSGDELTLRNTAHLSMPTRYRRTELGSKATEPVTYRFSYRLDGQPRSVPIIWPVLPSSAVRLLSEGTPQLNIGALGKESLNLWLSDFSGPGTYTLAMSGSYAGYSVSFCSDYLEWYQTLDDGLSTVTVTEYDTVGLRCKGTFDVTLHGPSNETKHAVGSFDVPVFEQ